jgi:hypothetical protein
MNMFIVGGLLLVGVPIVFMYFGKQFFAAGFFLLGTIIFADSLWAMRQEKALAANGMKALATASGDSYTEITKVKSGAKRYKTDISFTTATGEVVAENTEVTPATLEKFKRGEPVKVTYLPSRPGYYRFDPWSPHATQDLQLGLILMAIAGAWIGFKRLRAPKDEEAAA